MSDHHFRLSDAQFARIQPLLPNKIRGVPRVDDRRVISGPHKTLYNRFVRWSEAGVFNRIFEALAANSRATDTVMIDATSRWPTTLNATSGAISSRHVRQAQGLVAQRHTIRPMCTHLLQRHLHRRYRHLWL